MADQEIKNLYVAFKTGCSLFAVSASDVMYIMSSSEYNHRIAIPNMPVHIKSVIEAGGTLITVVDINEITKEADFLKKLIIVLKYDDQNIGVLVDEVQLITVLDGDYFKDSNTGLNFFRHNGNTYSMIDKQVITRMLLK